MYIPSKTILGEMEKIWYNYVNVLLHWRRKWQPTPVFLPGESNGQRSLVGYSPWGHKESDTAERLFYYYCYIKS